MTLTDTHCHIYDEKFDADRDEAIARAAGAGVTRIMMPAIEPQNYDKMFSVARRHPRVCLPMMGLHPTSVNDNPSWRDDLGLVVRYLASSPEGIRFYGVGETGLDLHWSKDFLKEQTEAFRRQIELALEYSLPIVIHTREAWNETLEVLSTYRGKGLKGIMHSFSGTLSHYETLKGIGRFMLGIGGVVTYKNSSVASLLERIPLEDILLETDAPYLSPVPFRGRRNEPAYTAHVCRAVAGVKGVKPEEIALITSGNAAEMFSLGSAND